MYNPEDNLLQFVYSDVESDNVLGWCGKEGGNQWFAFWWCFVGNRIGEPENYNEYSVINELPPNADSNSNGECDDILCAIFLASDNHFGYLGYRGLTTPISTNGAIDRIAADWEEQQ